MNLDSHVPPGPLAEKWDQHKFDMKLVNPANKRKYRRHRRRHRPGRRLGRRRRWPSSATTSTVFCFQDSPRRAHSHRRPGRHQRRQELPERRRQRLPPLLRHDQGRRLPLARGQRLPPGPGQRQHHRPVRRPGRAVRPRVRRPARQPLVRRRAGVAHLLRPRPDRPAAAARRLPGARAARSAPATVEHAPAHRDARPRRRRRPRRGIVVRDLVTGEIESSRRRRGGAGHRRLRQRLLPVDQRQGLQRHGDLARLQARRLLRQPLLHADPSDLHPGRPATTSRS